MFRFFVLFFSLFLLFFCKSSIVKKKELEKWRKELKSDYVSINDIFLYEYNFKTKEYEKISSSIILKKNLNVRLEFEAVDDWFRIRAFDLNNSKRDYLGDVIFYITLPDNGEDISTDDIKKIVFSFIDLNFKN